LIGQKITQTTNKIYNLIKIKFKIILFFNIKIKNILNQFKLTCVNIIRDFDIPQKQIKK